MSFILVINAMLSSGIPWNTYATRHLYFPYTHEPFRVNMIIEYFRKLSESSEIFEKFRKRFKAVFQQFYNFLKFLEKSSEVFGYHRKICGRDRNCL